MEKKRISCVLKTIDEMTQYASESRKIELQNEKNMLLNDIDAFYKKFNREDAFGKIPDFNCIEKNIVNVAIFINDIEDIVKNEYYLKEMNNIRYMYDMKEQDNCLCQITEKIGRERRKIPIFHIYSSGEKKVFFNFIKKKDSILHLDEDVASMIKQMIFVDVFINI